MNRLLLAMLLLAVAHLHASAQHLRARTNEQQQISISTFAPATTAAQPRSGEDGYEQLPGFPMAFVASKANKNFRNVTLADLDDDGAEEIIVAIANNLYLIDETGVVWKKGVAGIGIYPPSIADIDQDGSLDIIQVTGGIQQVGGIYIVDKDGNDLPGWPISINDNWILNSPAIADVDDDGSLEIIVNELSNPRGKVHLLKSDGSSYSDNWPALLDNTSAVTPSVGDVDNDGQKEIVFCSTRSIYVMELDGLPATGWPVQNPNTKFSFQSPVLVDFEDDGFMEIIGTAHGDLPEYYVFNHDGSYRNGWPVVIPDTSWSFSPPALYRDGSENFIFTSRPIFLPQDTMVTDDMFYAFDSTGQLQPGFPIQQQDGCEGLITLADVDDDDEMEVLFSSNTADSLYRGYLHAYELDGSREVEGFPLRPNGLTYMNGATIGDVNGDGKMNIAALSYKIDIDGTDSIFLHVYNLGVSCNEEKIAWGTYKGSNSRDGMVPLTRLLAPTTVIDNGAFSFRLSPNPSTNSTIHLQITSTHSSTIHLQLHDLQGRLLQEWTQQDVHVGLNDLSIELADQPAGAYFITLQTTAGHQLSRKLIRIK